MVEYQGHHTSYSLVYFVSDYLFQ